MTKMIWLQSFFIAFAMYSLVPVPIFTWNEKNMRYAMAFLPWVGVLCTILMAGWQRLSGVLEIQAGLAAAVMAALPVLISGGIHFDGFCDTVDALSSHKSREEKLDILKDSRTGAFAVFVTVFFVLVEYGVWQQLCQMDPQYLWVAIHTPILTRCLSGISVMTFPSARKNGLAATFAGMAAKRRTAAALAVQGCLCAAWMLYLSPIAAGMALLVLLIWFWRYHTICIRGFGGITGDLAGFFLTVAEFLLPCTVTLTALVLRL